jgi:serine/threonine protein kinase
LRGSIVTCPEYQVFIKIAPDDLIDNECWVAEALVDHPEFGCPFDRDAEGNEVEIGGDIVPEDLFDDTRFYGALADAPAIRTAPFHFVVSRFIVGRDLIEYVEDNDGACPYNEVHEIARELFRLLAVLHSCGIVHCDVKLDNLMLLNDGLRLVLIDFAFGCLEGESEIGGTPGYMAPEVEEGFEARPSRDIYAAGVVVFALFAGEMPEIFDDGIENWPDDREEITRQDKAKIEWMIQSKTTQRPLAEHAFELFGTPFPM